MRKNYHLFEIETVWIFIHLLFYAGACGLGGIGSIAYATAPIIVTAAGTNASSHPPTHVSPLPLTMASHFIFPHLHNCSCLCDYQHHRHHVVPLPHMSTPTATYHHRFSWEQPPPCLLTLCNTTHSAKNGFHQTSLLRTVIVVHRTLTVMKLNIQTDAHHLETWPNKLDMSYNYSS